MSWFSLKKWLLPQIFKNVTHQVVWSVNEYLKKIFRRSLSSVNLLYILKAKKKRVKFREYKSHFIIHEKSKGIKFAHKKEQKSLLKNHTSLATSTQRSKWGMEISIFFCFSNRHIFQYVQKITRNHSSHKMP